MALQTATDPKHYPSVPRRGLTRPSKVTKQSSFRSRKVWYLATAIAKFPGRRMSRSVAKRFSWMAIHPKNEATEPSATANLTGLTFRPKEASKVDSVAPTTKENVEEMEEFVDDVDIEEHKHDMGPGSTFSRLVEEFEKGPGPARMKELEDPFGEDRNSPARVAFKRRCDE